MFKCGRKKEKEEEEQRGGECRSREQCGIYTGADLISARPGIFIADRTSTPIYSFACFHRCVSLPSFFFLSLLFLRRPCLRGTVTAISGLLRSLPRCKCKPVSQQKYGASRSSALCRFGARINKLEPAGGGRICQLTRRAAR